MALPIVIFDFIQSFRLEKAPLKGAQYTLEFIAGCTREFTFDSNVLEDDIIRILYDYDVQGVPIYEQQVMPFVSQFSSLCLDTLAEQ